MFFITGFAWKSLDSIQYTEIIRILDEINRKQDKQEIRLDEINKKQDVLKECVVQVVAAKIHIISNSDTMKQNPDINLPDFPLKDSEDVTRLEIRLADPDFLNQMVNFLLCYLYVRVFDTLPFCSLSPLNNFFKYRCFILSRRRRLEPLT